MIIKDSRRWKGPTNLPNTWTFQWVQNSNSYSNQSKGTARLIKIYSHFAVTRHQAQGFCARIHPSHRLSRCLSENAQARWTARNTRTSCFGILCLIKDEPSLNQSDKAKIDLQLINNNKQYRGGKYNKVHSIENA